MKLNNEVMNEVVLARKIAHNAGVRQGDNFVRPAIAKHSKQGKHFEHTFGIWKDRNIDGEKLRLASIGLVELD
jgi:hypothetical protein